MATTTGDGATRTRVVMLGSGTPNADPDRSGPSLAVVVDGAAYLVDMGPGVVRRAAAAHRAGVEALAPRNLTRLFVTHLHSDHTAGYPDLMLTPWQNGRTAPLEVYGPPGTAVMTEHLRAAYAEDIAIRLEGREPANPEGHRAVARDVSPGVVYEDERVAVRAFAVDHGDWPHAYGYRFETPDRTIVISGDTTATPAIAANAEGCDLLLHEAYCGAALARRSAAWRAYHSRFHTSGEDAGRIAAGVQPGLLVLYHLLLWSGDEEDLLGEVRMHYDGKIEVAHDLDVFSRVPGDSGLTAPRE